MRNRNHTKGQSVKRKKEKGKSSQKWGGGREKWEKILSDVSRGSRSVKFSHQLERSFLSPKQFHSSGLLDATERRRGEEQADYVTPHSVLCLSQYSDVRFLTALVSNLASLLFPALSQSERHH